MTGHGMKMTKVEQHWRWLADRIWNGTLYGWAPLSDRLTKADRAIIERRVKANHIEISEHGMYRLTDVGRAALEVSR